MWPGLSKGVAMANKVKDNHKKYLERKNLFKSFGYDVDAERKFVFEKSLPISGNILEVSIHKYRSFQRGARICPFKS